MLPLGYELKAELSFRVIEKRNVHGSMGMPFLSHALYVMQCQAPINRGTKHRNV